jgi:integrase
VLIVSSYAARRLSLAYGCGLRASEVVRLKVKHIDSAQKIIRIEQGKPQGSQTRAARSVATMVEGAPIASRCGNTP